MTSAAKPRKRVRGEIEALPSGSFRVRVYAGLDPITKKRHDLTEVVPAGPKAAKLAEKARTRLLSEVDEQRSARTRMPALPTTAISHDVTQAGPTSDAEECAAASSPYQRIAADLRAAIRCGALREGDPLPAVKDLARRYNVSVGTAHRAVAALVQNGYVVASRGRRTSVARPVAHTATTSV
jgi:Bacterial regulatory proteins, gntR family